MDFLELLLGLLEPLLEAIFEYVAATIADLLLRALEAVVPEPYVEDPVLACLGYLLLGLFFGAMSLALFPHRLIRPSTVHGISLLVSPTLAGSMLSLTGKAFRLCGRNTTQLETFTYGFSFAFGLAAIRLLFAR